MKVSDIVSGRIKLSFIDNNKKSRKATGKQLSSEFSGKTKDALSLSKTRPSELAHMKEAQTVYGKNEISLKGFEMIEGEIERFERQPEDQKDYTVLSRKLKTMITQAKFNGEKINNYLSTDVKDAKQLYTLRMNLTKEIQLVRAHLKTSRNQIASFVVGLANRDAATHFDPENVINAISGQLKGKESPQLFQKLKNAQVLLQLEKRNG